MMLPTVDLQKHHRNARYERNASSDTSTLYCVCPLSSNLPCRASTTKTRETNITVVRSALQGNINESSTSNLPFRATVLFSDTHLVSGLLKFNYIYSLIPALSCLSFRQLRRDGTSSVSIASRCSLTCWLDSAILQSDYQHTFNQLRNVVRQRVGIIIGPHVEQIPCHIP